MATTVSKHELAAHLDAVDARLDHADCDHPEIPREAKVALALAEPALNDRAPSGPTRTQTIQSDYSAEMYKRFRSLKGTLRETVAANDAFGLTDGGKAVGALAGQSTPADSYDFPSSSEKIDAFLSDLQSWEDDDILDVYRRNGSGNVVSRDEWQNIYVRRSYGKGVEFADARLREQGIDVPKQSLAEVFNAPVHADALGVLYTRNFRELKGVTDAMDQQISRVLTRGFSEGWNPRKMATELNGRVDKIGLTRARTLARTETINAHSEATLNRYESILGPDAKVTGKAEFATAGDRRVCPICASLEGNVYTLDEARGIIPVHPNCRCAWIPVVRDAASNIRLVT